VTHYRENSRIWLLTCFQVRRDLLNDLTSGLTKGEDAPQPGQSKSNPNSATEDKDDKKKDPLTQLGLGGLLDGNTHHGLGLIPVGLPGPNIR
jgi:hypothetical protein